MGRRDDTNDQLAEFTCGIIVWAITAGIGLIIALIAWDRRRQREKYPDGKSLAPSAERARQSYILFGLILALLGGGVCYVGVNQSAYSSGSAVSVFIIGLALLLGGCGLAYAAWTQRLWHEAVIPVQPLAPESARVFGIRVPQTTVWNTFEANQFINELVSALQPLVFRIVATSKTIEWQVVDPSGVVELSLLERLVHAHFPQADVEEKSFETEEVPAPFVRYVCQYRQSNMFPAPLQYVDVFKTLDPLAALAQTLTTLEVGEQVIYTLAVAQLAAEAYEKGERLITQSTIHPLQYFSRAGVGDAIGKLVTHTDRREKYVPRDQRVLEDKLREKLYRCYLLIQVDTPQPQRLIDLLILVDSQLAQFTRMPYNAIQWVERPPENFAEVIETPDHAVRTSALAVLGGVLPTTTPPASALPSLILEPRELAALWHLPHAGFSASRIQWAANVAEVTEVVAGNHHGVFLGMGRYQRKAVPIRIPPQDRVTHLNIVGKTGTGKSTLLHHLIHQDIANGRGVAVLDPHGKLVSDILRTSIPTAREQDVVIIDLANDVYPPPLNPLIGAKDYSSTLKMVSIIDRMFEGTEESARMAGYLRAALIPLQTESQATMRDVTRLFMDAVYRQQRLEAVDDPETQDFWDYHYNPSSPALQRQIAEPIIIRVRPFYANPTLYPVLCHPDTLDFRVLMEQNKIILISLALDEERVPEQERNLVGALLMSRLQMSGMKERAERKDPFFIYVDEVQKFVTTSLSDVLSEARKFGLSLVTANQFLGQLTGKTLEAVMGNVGTTIVFRCSPDDAQTLSAYMKPTFNAHDLVDLDRFQAVLKMQIGGATQPAFSLQTLPPLPVPQDEAAREDYLRALSIANYTPKPRAEVLAWLRARYGKGKSEAAESTPMPDDPNHFYDPV